MKKTLKLKLPTTEGNSDSKSTETQTTQIAQATLNSQLAEAKTKLAAFNSFAAVSSQNKKLELVNFPSYLMHTQKRYISVQKQGMEQIERQKESVELLKEINENLKNPLHSMSNENYQQKYNDLKIENERLKAANEALKNQSNNDISESERESVLKLILGMAMDAYRYEPFAERNAATGANNGSIHAALAKQGLPIKDPKTIRKYLQEAEKLLKLSSKP